MTNIHLKSSSKHARLHGVCNTNRAARLLLNLIEAKYLTRNLRNPSIFIFSPEAQYVYMYIALINNPSMRISIQVCLFFVFCLVNRVFTRNCQVLSLWRTVRGILFCHTKIVYICGVNSMWSTRGDAYKRALQPRP